MQKPLEVDDTFIFFQSSESQAKVGEQPFSQLTKLFPKVIV